MKCFTELLGAFKGLNMRRRKPSFLKFQIGVIAFVLLFVGCSHKQKPAVSFYYWKTIFKISGAEKDALTANHVSKLYVRYFDIALHDGKAYPKSPIRFAQKPTRFQIIPVIYIKNEVMLSPNTDAADLAKKSLDFINQINQSAGISCREIQLDCDWTLQSRDKYMAFVSIFRKASGKKLSATIRLHQVKYFKKTKVPDVDYGVLMYYNIGNVAPDSMNSIYDRQIAQKYSMSLANYPLKLNIALPIFSWAIHIREHKVIGVKSKWTIRDLQKDTNFIAVGKLYFRVENSFYKSGDYYKKGDFIKFESTSEADLQEMADDLENQMKNTPTEIIFYDLDQYNLKNYEKGFFEKITARF